MLRRPHDHRAGAVTLLSLLCFGLLSFSLASPVAPASGAARPSGAVASEALTTRTVQAPSVDPLPALSQSVPVRVQIPAIGVDSGLIELGLERDGSMQVPADGFPAGWYRYGPTPGELGPAVIAGHVDWAGAPGVFFRLHSVIPGNVVRVTRRDGTVAAFVVTRTSRTAKSSFPTAAVYGDVDHPALRLITCGGSFDRAARSYRDNIVVFADLITT